MLGCDLKLLQCDWLTAVVKLQNLAGVKGGELSVCYEAVAPFYNTIAMQHPLYISSSETTCSADQLPDDKARSEGVSTYTAIEDSGEAPVSAGCEESVQNVSEGLSVAIKNGMDADGVLASGSVKAVM